MKELFRNVKERFSFIWIWRHRSSKTNFKNRKKAIFTDLGSFYLETNNDTRCHYEEDKRYIKFKPDSKLKNVIWQVLYYGVDHKKKECSDIANHLISLHTIDLVNFGKVYIYFDPGYFTWHDFHNDTTMVLDNGPRHGSNMDRIWIELGSFLERFGWIQNHELSS